MPGEIVKPDYSGSLSINDHAKIWCTYVRQCPWRPDFRDPGRLLNGNSSYMLAWQGVALSLAECSGAICTRAIGAENADSSNPNEVLALLSGKKSNPQSPQDLSTAELEKVFMERSNYPMTAGLHGEGPTQPSSAISPTHINVAGNQKLNTST